MIKDDNDIPTYVRIFIYAMFNAITTIHFKRHTHTQAHTQIRERQRERDKGNKKIDLQN